MKNFILLDGAIGTILTKEGFHPPFENLSFEEPLLIKRIHEEYLQAGSEILLTHTFNAQTIAQCEGAWNVIKDLPVKKFASIGPHANGPVLIDFFQDKVDRLVFETIYDLERAKSLIREYHVLNPIFSFCLKPHDFKEIISYLKNYQLTTIGINCVNGFQDIENLLALLPSHYEIYLKPNSGVSEHWGPKEFSQEFSRLLERYPLRYIGGCCGTTPAHIAQLQKLQKVRRT